MIGVNQRDLYTFEVDHARRRMAGEIPAGVVKVAESGVRDAEDARRLRRRRLRRDPGGGDLVTSAPDPRADDRAMAATASRAATQRIPVRRTRLPVPFS